MPKAATEAPAMRTTRRFASLLWFPCLFYTRIIRLYDVANLGVLLWKF
jgi:hypothetical protein